MRELKKMIIQHSKLEKTIYREKIDNNSQDSDVIDEAINSDISQDELKDKRGDSNLYFDKIERIFVTFLSMDTNDKIKELFSPKQK